jgi:E3 ubiquitin-protein ligase synoviolin
LTNLFLVATGWLLYGLQRLLYGQLRPIETEQLYEKAWFAVTETCLAMTIFRGELGGWFLVMFVCLLVGKVWGWIGEGRVEILEQQPPASPRLFHTRLASSLFLSVAFDVFLLDYAVRTVLEQARADMMVMFGFEFAILTILSSSTLARYCISVVEIYIKYRQKTVRLAERRAEIRSTREQAIREHQESGGYGVPDTLPDENDIDEMDLDIPGWEEKGRWVFYLDLITDFFKLVVYLSFFAILFMFYGLPIHILRDVVVTIRSFVRRLADFMRYRTATRDMNERYPDATPEEIGEDVCIICREEMVAWQQPAPEGNRRAVPERLRAKKLPCGHILHFACLRSWLERQQNCPTCRRPVVVPRNQQYRGNNANNNDGRGNAAAQPGANQPNNVAGDGQPQARVYQFGPFRVGFGAGRGDMFRNLQQQIHGNNNAAAAQPANIPAGAQQFGFGFGFGRPQQQQQQQQATTTAPTNLVNIQNQLANLELQIAQEYQSLRATADQLHVLRALQTELQRLRTSQQNPITAQPLTDAQPTSAAFAPAAAAPSIHQLNSQTSSPIPAGDSRLPQGLVLPQGWMVTPLRRIEPSVAPNATSAPTPAPAQVPTFVPSVPSPPPSVLDPQLFSPIPPPPPAGNDTGNASSSAQNTAEQEQELEEQQTSDLNRISPSFEWPDEDSEDNEDTTAGDSNLPSSSNDNGHDKGKARAATVEDDDDDDDDDEN